MSVYERMRAKKAGWGSRALFIHIQITAMIQDTHSNDKSGAHTLTNTHVHTAPLKFWSKMEAYTQLGKHEHRTNPKTKQTVEKQEP